MFFCPFRYTTGMADRLPRSFYRRDVVKVARGLLGQQLVRVLRGRLLSGIIVETEAYLGAIDKAAHTCNGLRTARNASMWGDGGCAYVYFTYGMHHCVNVVAGCEGDPVAVLIRGLEPVEGIEQMRQRRAAARRRRKTLLKDTDLCSGPAKLTSALGIDLSLDGADLVRSSDLFIRQMRARAHRGSAIVATPRIGVSYAGKWADKPLRFFLKGNKHVSR